MALDENKVEALRRWGEGLRQAGSEELAAAGRAILLLIEEVERLRAERSPARRPPDLVSPASTGEAGEQEEPASTLHERLQRALGEESGARAEPMEEGAATTEGDEATTSPQSWIEALRRRT
jgi:hypothetical protein